MICRNVLRSGCILLGLTVWLTISAITARAQGHEGEDSWKGDMPRLKGAGIGLLASVHGSEQRAVSAQVPARGERMSTRQTWLIGGLAASIGAYGYFLLQFNNSRGKSENAEQAYRDDVRQNAQSYVDQGVALDEIQTFRDWQKAFDDARGAREWAARAGFVAILVGFFAILDASTSHDAPVAPSSHLSVRPTLGLAPVRNDLIVGARVKF